MKDKKFSLFSKARLVKGKQRWYIYYKQTNPETNELERFRPTFGLNFLKDLQVREKKFKEKVIEVNNLLPKGYPFESKSPKAKYEALINHLQSFLIDIDNEKERKKVGTKIITEINQLLPKDFSFLDEEDPKNSTINDALDFFEENKYPDICADAVRAYKRLVIDIREYVADKKLHCKISKMNSLHGLGIMKFIWDKREIGNNTYNRYLKDAIILFNFLKKYKFVEDNIFLGVKPKKKRKSRFVKITDNDKKIIAAYLKKFDYQLFLIVQLIHGCFIRPIEVTRLKFSYFNFENGTITLPDYATKNGKRRTMTIPDDRVHYFRNKDFKDNHPNLFCFGLGLVPSEFQSNEDRINTRHRKHLVKMVKLGLLISIKGYSAYCWKKTGVSNAYRAGIKGEFIRQQCDHSTEKITQIYNDTDEVNFGMKAFSDSLE